MGLPGGREWEGRTGGEWCREDARKQDGWAESYLVLDRVALHRAVDNVKEGASCWQTARMNPT